VNSRGQTTQPEVQAKEANRLRSLAAQTTTPRMKKRLLDLARDQERLGDQAAPGASPHVAAREPGLLVGGGWFRGS